MLEVQAWKDRFSLIPDIDVSTLERNITLVFVPQGVTIKNYKFDRQGASEKAKVYTSSKLTITKTIYDMKNGESTPTAGTL